MYCWVFFISFHAVAARQIRSLSILLLQISWNDDIIQCILCLWCWKKNKKKRSSFVTQIRHSVPWRNACSCTNNAQTVVVVQPPTVCLPLEIIEKKKSNLLCHLPLLHGPLVCVCSACAQRQRGYRTMVTWPSFAHLRRTFFHCLLCVVRVYIIIMVHCCLFWCNSLSTAIHIQIVRFIVL